MAYVIDIVYNAMSKLSSEKPSLFQRDGMLYVVSKEGFGQVNYGLQAYARPEERKHEPEAPEILVSNDILTDKRLAKKEEPHLKPICFGEDTRHFSLQNILQTGEALAKLPDDERVRIVSHGSRYHSHKYGYAADGVDVWLGAARVMDRENYLAMMRKKQDDVVEEMRQYKSHMENYRKTSSFARDSVQEYKQKEVPSGVIMTQHVLATFPQIGELNVYNANNAWSKETSLESNLIKRHPIDTSRESPFQLHTIVNGHHIVVDDAKQFAEKCGAFVGMLATQTSAINQVAPDIDAYITHLNAVHNDVCKSEIKYWVDFRERISRDDKKPARAK